MTGVGDPEVVWFEDFAAGFDIGRIGSTSRWHQFESGAFLPDDAVATVTENGLSVIPKGVNRLTGEPAFLQTVAPSPPDAEVPGVVDHVKWFATVNRRSSKDGTGFDTRPGRTLHIETLLGGHVFGTDQHPFGTAVRDIDRDFRLGAAAMLTMDKETNVVFSFFLTNTAVFALYERAPFARGEFGNYASFSYAVLVGSRRPEDMHELAISYDRDANTARWLLGGEVVLEVDRVGRRLDRRHMVIDVGGEEQEVSLDQLECGLGMYTLLDASVDGGPGLVDLYGYPMFFDTVRGAPHLQRYVDSQSLQGSRIFGQGAQIRCRTLSISYR